ncbi:hypothetical protein [Plesiomonas sp.]|uniref:hypothetical protein n=1 Tax=Plesiomonas sp. TaxID=2486279 RepID=UPI003F2FC0DB
MRSERVTFFSVSLLLAMFFLIFSFKRFFSNDNEYICRGELITSGVVNQVDKSLEFGMEVAFLSSHRGYIKVTGIIDKSGAIDHPLHRTYIFTYKWLNEGRIQWNDIEEIFLDVDHGKDFVKLFDKSSVMTIYTLPNNPNRWLIFNSFNSPIIICTVVNKALD